VKWIAKAFKSILEEWKWRNAEQELNEIFAKDDEENLDIWLETRKVKGLEDLNRFTWGWTPTNLLTEAFDVDFLSGLFFTRKRNIFLYLVERGWISGQEPVFFTSQDERLNEANRLLFAMNVLHMAIHVNDFLDEKMMASGAMKSIFLGDKKSGEWLMDQISKHVFEEYVLDRVIESAGGDISQLQSSTVRYPTVNSEALEKMMNAGWIQAQDIINAKDGVRKIITTILTSVEPDDQKQTGKAILERFKSVDRDTLDSKLVSTAENILLKKLHETSEASVQLKRRNAL
jgi:hypothetical protein